MFTNPVTSREIRLAARPIGEPKPTDFAFAEVPVPAPGPGEILVRNTWMSVDPYMRGRMNDVESYIPPFAIGAPLDGGAVGEVIESNAPTVPVGATVSHFQGWRDYALLPASAATVVDTNIAPAEAYLSTLGTTGLTAYATLREVAPVREGDVVFISAAAGAVGSIAGQLARKLGASRVIGSAGGPVKGAKLLSDFGYDVAIDYRAGSVADQLTEAAPDGIDVYVDSVGGDHLRAALSALRTHGRVALVGAISQYNATEPVPGPDNLFLAVGKQLSLRGMIVTSYFHLYPEYIGKAAGWLADGSLHAEQTVMDGLDQAPAAFFGVLNGANTGKMLVRLT
ncbi:MAG: NADP-dependent oxidoreductase [Actinomycetota bacterium]|nr:NADP-dependent oxidoreductase [Actinomycetota bacterium]